MDSSHKDKNPSNKNSKNTCNFFSTVASKPLLSDVWLYFTLLVCYVCTTAANCSNQALQAKPLIKLQRQDDSKSIINYGVDIMKLE